MANHSHVCGINSANEYKILQRCESFPRMWDQRSPYNLIIYTQRIIPTYVGSTVYMILVAVLTLNHSHVCGINGAGSAPPRIAHESFPRMWDQLLDRKASPDLDRIIPTYVGSTAYYYYQCGAKKNHSHVCGINATESETDTAEFESFPRMWDQRTFHPSHNPLDRIIPTYVGSTTKSRNSRP